MSIVNLIKRLFPDYKTKKELKKEIDRLECALRFQSFCQDVDRRKVERVISQRIRGLGEPEEYTIKMICDDLSRYLIEKKLVNIIIDYDYSVPMCQVKYRACLTVVPPKKGWLDE